jgi:hypothetical protein
MDMLPPAQEYGSRSPASVEDSGSSCNAQQDGPSPAPDAEIASSVTIPQQLAWRLFTKGIDRDSTGELKGNRELEDVGP